MHVLRINPPSPQSMKREYRTVTSGVPLAAGDNLPAYVKDCVKIYTEDWTVVHRNFSHLTQVAWSSPLSLSPAQRDDTIDVNSFLAL